MSCSIAGGAGLGAGPGPESGSGSGSGTGSGSASGSGSGFGFGSGVGTLDSGSRVSGVGAGSDADSVLQSLGESPVASTYSTSSLGDPELELQARLFRDLMSEARPAQALASWSALRSTTGAYDPATDDSILGRGGYGSSDGQQHLNTATGRSEVDPRPSPQAHPMRRAAHHVAQFPWPPASGAGAFECQPVAETAHLARRQVANLRLELCLQLGAR